MLDLKSFFEDIGHQDFANGRPRMGMTYDGPVAVNDDLSNAK